MAQTHKYLILQLHHFLLNPHLRAHGESSLGLTEGGKQRLGLDGYTQYNVPLESA